MEPDKRNDNMRHSQFNHEQYLLWWIQRIPRYKVPVSVAIIELIGLTWMDLGG